MCKFFNGNEICLHWVNNGLKQLEKQQFVANKWIYCKLYFMVILVFTLSRASIVFNNSNELLTYVSKCVVFVYYTSLIEDTVGFDKDW